MDGARPGRKSGVTGEMQAPADAENSTDGGVRLAPIPGRAARADVRHYNRYSPIARFSVRYRL